MSLNRVKPLLSQLDSTLEDRQHLIELKLDPSVNDNYDLTNLLSKITKILESQKTASEAEPLVKQYNQMVSTLDSDLTMSFEEYKIKIPESKPKELKSVRFTDNDDDEDLRNELMGTRAFQPYKDSPEDIPEDGSEGNGFGGIASIHRGPGDGDSIDLNNHQLFAQHQQQVLDQDMDLDALHDSVRVQKSMGININQELDDHLIMLSDLENGVGSSQRRIDSTVHRLNDFRSRVQENGSLVTIITLTVILILLLVVLN